MTGSELKALREQAGLTQGEVATRCNKSIGWLRRRELEGVPIDNAWAQFFISSITGAQPQEWSASEVLRLREGYGLSQTVFAERLGVSKLSVGRWERGSAVPSEGNIIKLNALRAKLLKERT